MTNALFITLLLFSEFVMFDLGKIIEKDKLLNKQEKVILACSGGMDSMCLAHLLLSAQIPFSIAHVNYNLRGEESTSDQSFIIHWGWQHNVTIHTLSTHISDAKGNTQKKARDIRYAWLNDLVKRNSYKFILTAHHEDDLLEGAIFKWWRGVPWSQRFLMKNINHNIYRPLLGVTRSDIETYVLANQIPYRQDSSNLSSDKYDRNFIRLQLLPLLQSKKAQSRSVLKKLFHDEEEDRQLMHSLVKHLLSNTLLHEKDGWTLSLEALPPLDRKKLIRLLAHIFKQLGMNEKWANQIFQANTGAQWTHRTGTLFLDRNKLIFRRSADVNEQSIIVSSTGLYRFLNCKIEIHPGTYNLHGGDSKNICFVPDRFNFPWTFRKWQSGDRMAPEGLNGKSKKVKEIFSDQKISNFQKSRVPILLIDNEIHWLAGIKLSDALINPALGSKGYWLIVTPD